MATFPLSTLLVTFSVTFLLVLTVKGQETPSCAQSLVPCGSYISSTNPPSSCCGPLKTAIDTQLTCLCNLYNTPGLLKSLGINITEALLLPKRCKLSGDLNSCVKASGPASSSQTPPPPASPGNDKDGANSIAGIGILSILSFWALMVLF